MPKSRKRTSKLNPQHRGRRRGRSAGMKAAKAVAVLAAQAVQAEKVKKLVNMERKQKGLKMLKSAPHIEINAKVGDQTSGFVSKSAVRKHKKFYLGKSKRLVRGVKRVGSMSMEY